MSHEPLPPAAVAINCVDGRVQDPVLGWLRRTLGCELVHAVNEPGPDAALRDAEDDGRVERIVRMLASHGPIEAIAVVAHDDCRGNPVDEATHRRQVAEAAETVASWGLAGRVLGLWVDRDREVAVVTDASFTR